MGYTFNSFLMSWKNRHSRAEVVPYLQNNGVVGDHPSRLHGRQEQKIKLPFAKRKVKAEPQRQTGLLEMSATMWPIWEIAGTHVCENKPHIVHSYIGLYTTVWWKNRQYTTHCEINYITTLSWLQMQSSCRCRLDCIWQSLQRFTGWWTCLAYIKWS